MLTLLVRHSKVLTFTPTGWTNIADKAVVLRISQYNNNVQLEKRRSTDFR